MKLSTPQSTKFMKLKRRLSLTHWQCVGLLESVWLFTQLNSPAGDIGKHPNEDIAAAIEWGGNHDDLITALVECGFIDECDVARLVIHDWHDHAPTYLKGAMAKHGKDFCRPVKKSAKQPAKQGAKGGHGVGRTPGKQPAPNHTKPNQTEPSEPTSTPAVAGPTPPPPPPPKIKPPPDPNHKPAVDGFCSRWESTYGQKYAFNAGKDADAVKWMLSQVADLPTLFAVFDRYLADRSDFVTSARHTLGVLRSQFVKWTVDQLPPASAPRPAGGFKTKQQQQADTFARLADFLEESERAALNPPEGQP